MPEIKHRFTGGKMNKDLDERLVPNGEYRDAMNIQVLTSEGSDVGTMHNILGNSLVDGQEFITADSFCVGSIADEKNDKLYWFVKSGVELLTNGNFVNGLFDWNLLPSPGSTWAYGDEAIQGNNVQQNHKINQGVDSNVFFIGRYYEVSFTVKNWTQGALSARLHNENGDGFFVSTFYPTSDTKTYTFYKKILPNSVLYSSSGVYQPSHVSRFWIQVSGVTPFIGDIDNISIRQASSSIIEYDSVTNKMTPVLVDTIGNTLRLNANKKITGINIIDSLLLWTDNESEPKKINIQKSIEGTDASGIVHTKLINEYQNISIENNVDLEEKHITVVKAPPKNALKLNLIGPEVREEKIYTGLIKTTDDSLTSSFIQNLTTNSPTFSNFGDLSKSDVFQTVIPQDNDENTTFKLDWKIGDTVVFKEFEDGIDKPSTPLKTWAARGVLEEWSAGSFHNKTISLLTQDSLINQGGAWTKPDVVFDNYLQSNGWSWNAFQQKISWRDPLSIARNLKIYQAPASHVFKSDPHGNSGGSYTLTYTLYNRTIDGVTYTPGVKAVIIDGESNAYHFPTSLGTGAKSQTITLNQSTVQDTELEFSNIIYLIYSNGSAGYIDNIKLVYNNGPNSPEVQVKILNIDNDPPVPSTFNQSELWYVMDVYREPGKLFENTFSRFSYRYKYRDGEYSPVAPFSSVAFSPGGFDLHPKKGYNLGMVNNLIEIELSGFTTEVPADVESIDILTKTEVSTNVYIVDTIKKQDPILSPAIGNAWGINKYSIQSDTVKGIIPANQSLRPWDNVPKRALSQEVTGNRLVYGNYKQGYNLKTYYNEVYNPNFNWVIESINSTNSKKSLKSLRDYQVGIVFSDEYGRETPVISNESASFYVDKGYANNNNVLKVGFIGKQEYPVDMKYFKFFIKETSSEYYNIAMDRYYIDDDKNFWLSFPSSDRNKINENTVLVLKKGAESNELVSEEANYDILAIENEAPNFIKINKLLIEEKKHESSVTSQDLFENFLAAPLEDRNRFEMKYKPFSSSSGDRLHEIDDGNLYVSFTAGGTNKTTKRYRISQISSDVDDDGVSLNEAIYSVRLDTVLDEDVNFITDDISGVAPTKILDGTIVSIYKYELDETASYEGRFFVKIFGDDIFNVKIQIPTLPDQNEYSVVGSKRLYFMRPDHCTNNKHDSAVTGLTDGAYNTDRTYHTPHDLGTTVAKYQSHEDNPNALTYNFYHATNGTNPVGPLGFNSLQNFSKFAVFFRNYAYENASHELKDETGVLTNMGKYRFGVSGYGTGLNAKNGWLDEFLNYTSSGSINWERGWNRDVVQGANNFGLMPKGAREDGKKWEKRREEDDEVWFIDGGPYVSKRHTNNALHWSWTKEAPTDSSTSLAKINSGITEYSDGWKMDIGLGGIFGQGTNNYQANFFGVIGNSSNANYQDDNTVGFVEKFTPGVQFRFKEDPGENVYTAYPTTTRTRSIRYSANYKYGHSHQGGAFRLHQHEIPNASPNFTNNWKLNIKPALEWNPAPGGYGPIEGGLHIEIPCSSAPTTYNTTGIDIKDYYIRLGNSNIGTGIISAHGVVDGALPITPGLILTNYNNAGTPVNPPLLVKNVVEDGSFYNVYLCGYERLLTTNDIITPTAGHTLTFKQPAMNGYSENSTNRINANSSTFSIENPGLKAVGYTVEVVRPLQLEQTMPDNPAIFETEPRETTDLDIYYEASGQNVMTLDETTINEVLPVNSIVTRNLDSDEIYGELRGNHHALITSNVGENTIHFSQPIQMWSNSKLKVIREDGSISYISASTRFGGQQINNLPHYTGITVNTNLLNELTILDWHNCYSFGNGVESNRIKDSFNAQYISNGVKVSTTLEGNYSEEHRGNGLIYSGIYNSTSSTNNLNQFIAAEKITKDINPIYGSIQKLHARDGDLITLCEDKCLRILSSGKDALYNADGNPQLLASENVLGQAIPFSGEFGISKNPESFASQSYRVYFTDKARGAVMRLSRDGLTAISDHGMKDWFRDNLKLGQSILGTYDDRKEEYNLTIKKSGYQKTLSFNENSRGWVSFKSFIPEDGLSCNNDYYTLDAGKLWKHHDESIDRNTFYNDRTASSFTVLLNERPEVIKSFHTLNYEGTQANIDELKTYNTTMPGSGLINKTYDNKDYYNLTSKVGWYVDSISTNKEEGSLNEFIEKEGKWFNHIKGKTGSTYNIYGQVLSGFDNSDNAFQGLGKLESIAISTSFGCTCDGGAGTGAADENDCYNDGIAAFNYAPAATQDDGSCIAVIEGCDDMNASANYNPAVNTNNGTCQYWGCMDATAFNFDNTATHDPNNVCVATILGCTVGDAGYYNYSPDANVDDGSCVSAVYGCIDALALNANVLANVDDGTCQYLLGCTDTSACNYMSTATQDDGSCILPDGCTDPNYLEYNPAAFCDDGSCVVLVTNGCMDVTACNYQSAATVDDGSCILPDGCTDVNANNYDAANLCDDGSCTYNSGCTDPNANNYDATAYIDDGSCTYNSGCTCDGGAGTGAAPANDCYGDGIAAANYDPSAYIDDSSCVQCVNGCTTASATNYDPLATCDDGSCIYCIYGCMDATAANYNPAATCSNGSCTYGSTTYVGPYNSGWETKLIAKGLDTGPANNYVYTSNINTITTLDLNGSGMVNRMNGLHDFAALKYFTPKSQPVGCDHAHIGCNATIPQKSLDFQAEINQLSALEGLNAFSCDLHTLDLSPNTNLVGLNVSTNYLEYLNIANGNTSGFTIVKLIYQQQSKSSVGLGGTWVHQGYTLVEVDYSFFQTYAVPCTISDGQPIANYTTNNPNWTGGTDLLNAGEAWGFDFGGTLPPGWGFTAAVAGERFFITYPGAPLTGGVYVGG